MTKIVGSTLLLLLATGIHLYGQCEILLWEDDFESENTQPVSWNMERDDSGGGNDELQFYTRRDTNVYIENGKLILRALEEEYGGHNYTSGKVTTRGVADWRYGRMEARIKLPEGQGIWPAFWMMPSENKYGTWPNSGEIDIMELIGSEPATVYGTIHYGPPWNYSNGMYQLPEGTFSQAYHDFSLEWTADSMKWYVDDQLYSTKSKDDLSRPEQWQVFQERFYLILNLAVGGNWPGNPDETTVFPQKMEIEHVRVYGDPGNQEIIAMDSAYPRAEGVRYSFTDIPGAVFNWSVPEGAVIASGQGTHSILVDWGCNPGDITLEVSNLDCGNQHYTLPVEFASLRVEGPGQLFPLSEAVFHAPELSGTTYDWSFPGDAELLSSASDSITLRWGCSEGRVKLVAENTCATLSDSISITLKEPAISGPATVAENSINIWYSVDPVPSSTFTWSVPPDASITGGQGSDSISVEFGTEAGTVSVEISNQCYTRSLDLPVRITDTILLADYETTSPLFEVFSDTEFEIVENPAPDEVNNSGHVGKTFKSEVAWAGIYTDLGYNLDMTRHKQFRMSVLGPKNATILFKLEDNDEGIAEFREVPAEYTDAGQWQQLEFIFPDAETDVFDRITLFFDFGSEDTNFFYFDNILLLPYNDTGTTTRSTKPAELAVYPNPFYQDLYMNIPGVKRKLSLTWSDLRGRILSAHTVYSGNGLRIPTTSLDAGIYLLSVSDGNHSWRKIVVKHN